MTVEEKDSLIAKAQRDYPKDAKFISPVSGGVFKSDGKFRISEDGDVITGNGTVFNGQSKKWAKIKGGKNG